MNIENVLKKTLSPSQYQAIHILGEQFNVLGVRAFLVGGTVRDLILGNPITDLDIVVESNPQELVGKFDVKYEIEVLSYSQFGTCKINLLDQTIDLAMARSEKYPSPGDLPVVEQASFEDDLARRDFSINTLAVGINTLDWCELFDFHGGLADLKSKRIRVLHFKSFEDDPTRIFRGLRYSGRLGFELEDKTEKMMIEGLDFLPFVSGVRIMNEMEKIFHESNSAAILSSLDQYKVLKYIHQSFPNGLDLTNRIELFESLDTNLYNKCLYALISLTNSTQRQDLIKRMNLGNKFLKFASDITRIESLDGAVSRIEVHHQLKQVSEMAVKTAITYVPFKTKSNIELFLQDLNKIQLLIDGQDLMDLGIPQGPMVGAVLSKTLNHMIESGPLSKSEQILVAKSFI